MLLCALPGALPGWAQDAPAFNAPQISIPRVDPPPKLEDFLEMKPGPAVEGRMIKVEAFLQLEPKDGAAPLNRTEVYLGYDQDNLYAAWVAFAREPGAMRAQMSRRDSVEFEQDVVALYLDTFNDHLRAYNFLANPQGVQTDAIWTDPYDRDPSFDTVWHAEARRNGKGYVVLMTIPFKSLRFPPGAQQTWGLLLQRWNPHDGENSFWPALSTQVQGRLSRQARMDGLDGISSARNIQIMP
ncbi:MAG: carbohydrate binding family 9 domain-containing protein, partial [Terriglobales bacterium]